MTGPDEHPSGGSDNRPDSERRAGDYRLARITAALTLTTAIALLVVADAIIPGYDVNPVTLGILVGGVLALLGLAVSDRVIHG